MRINLNGLDFNTTPDVNGAQWMITEMDGWDAPNMRQSFGVATSRHGAVLQESMLDSRTIILRGVCKAQGESGFWAAYNGLLGLTNNLVVPKWLTVYETTPKRLAVIRGGIPRISFIGVGSFTFEVALVAMDPLKYTTDISTVAIAAGATKVVNVDGTFPTWPTFTGSGVMNVLHVGSATRVATTPASMPGGTVMNMDKRTMYSGAANRYSSITPTSVWWALQPGTNSVKNDGTVSVTMTYHPAWI